MIAIATETEIEIEMIVNRMDDGWKQGKEGIRKGILHIELGGLLEIAFRARCEERSW